MTFEEMERTMQFILEQQAHLTVKQAEAEERITRLEEAQAAAGRQIEHLSTVTAERIEQLGERIENLAATSARQIDHLGAALVELTEAHGRTEAALARLAEAQAHGERRLDALIDFVRGSKDGGT